MSITVSITNTTDAGAITKKAVDNDLFWIFAASEWYRLYYDWIPMDTTSLATNVTISPKEITHNMPYAGPQYEGEIKGSPIVNRSRDKHPLASSRWDEAAAPTQGPKLEKALESFLDKESVTG